MAWIANAGNKELPKQWYTFQRDNEYGRYNDDIQMVESEILRRMGGK